MAPKNYILSSQIARLVLGYLSEYDQSCFSQFLDSSPYLYDDREASSHSEDLSPNLKYEGLSLKEILQEYAHALHSVETMVCNLYENEIFCRKGNLPEKLRTVVDFCVQQKESLQPRRLYSEKEVQCELVQSTSNAFSAREVYCTRCQQQNGKEESTGKAVNVSFVTSGVVDNEPAGDLNVSLSSPLPEVPDTPGAGLVFTTALPPPLLSRNVGSKAYKSSTVDSTPRSLDYPSCSQLACNSLYESDTAALVADNDVCENSVTPELQHCLKPTTRILRSKSCSDLRCASPIDYVKKSRRSFLTPGKVHSNEHTESLLQSSLHELLGNRVIQEKLARSINQARTEVTEGATVAEAELDQALQSIIEKTTADPSFDEIVNETLSNYESFDMMQFLKPKSMETRSEDNLSIQPRSTAARKSKLAAVADISPNPAITAEMVPYPDIRYGPVDECIYITDVDPSGEVVFYSNPKHNTPGLFLPPPPPKKSSSSSRYREIQPKPLKTPEFSYNVVVCTPTMPAQLLPPEPVRPQLKKSRKSESTGMGQSSIASNASSSPHHIIIPPTPGRAYTDDMPLINFSATPQHSRLAELCSASSVPLAVSNVPASIPAKEPTPVAAGVPLPPDVTPHPLVSVPRKRQTQSTPRRKAYIRTLEFETPQKIVDQKKCNTSPKKDPHLSNTNPEGTSGSVKSNQKIIPSVHLEKLKNDDGSMYASETHQSGNTVASGVSIDSLNLKKGRKGGCLEAQNMKTLRRSTRGSSSSDSKRSSSPTVKAPIACRTPNKPKLSNFWDPITTVMGASESSSISGKDRFALATSTKLEEQNSIASTSTVSNVGSVLNDAGNSKRKIWDLHLRESLGDTESAAKSSRIVHRRRRKIKPNKSAKQQKVANNSTIVTRSKTAIMSPSKKHAKSTTKRNTYAISHGSSSAFESSSSEEETLVDLVKNTKRIKSDFSEITPGKVDVIVTANEDTPFTKLLRENVDSVFVDLSMIQTPVFPPTPSISCVQEQMTPVHETRRTDYSSGSSYYKPDLTSPESCLKGVVGMETVKELEISEEHLQDVSTVSGRNLVLTPEEKESLPTKQNKITDYYKKNESGLETRHATRGSSSEQSLQSMSESSFNNEQTTVMNLSMTTTRKDPGSNAKSDTTFLAPKRATSFGKGISITTQIATEGSSVRDREVLSPKLPTVESGQKEICMNNCNDDRITNILNEGRKILPRRKVSGKIMSFLKLQMIAQCDTKLAQNIPISGQCNVREPSFSEPHDEAIDKAPVLNKPMTCFEVQKNPPQTFSEDFLSEAIDPAAIHKDVEELSSAMETREKTFEVCEMWKKNHRRDDTKVKPSVSAIAEKLSMKMPLSTKIAGTSNVFEEMEMKRIETISKIRNDSSSQKRPRKPQKSATKKFKLSPRVTEVIVVRNSPRKTEVLPAPLVCSTPNNSSKASLSVSDADNSLKPESPIECPQPHDDWEKPGTGQKENVLSSLIESNTRNELVKMIVPSRLSHEDHREKNLRCVSLPTEGGIVQNISSVSSKIRQESPESNSKQRNQKKTSKRWSSSNSSPKCKEDLPPFEDDGEFPDLPLLTKKKLFGVKCILEMKEVRQFLENETAEIHFNSFMRGLFRTLFKWLQNPREDEIACAKVQDRIILSLEEFEKISDGMSRHNHSNESVENRADVQAIPVSGTSTFRSKVPTLLPLKKRKSSAGGAQASNAQKMLKQIDVDCFLSRVHGHDSS